MEKIDLTKCNNCRYKATIDGNDDYGRICVENADKVLAFLRSDKEDGYIAVWHCDEMLIRGISGRKVTDFEIVPRDPETYQDWQVGDKIIRNANVGTVILRYGEVVLYKCEVLGVTRCCASPYTCEELFCNGYRLVLTDIEEQIIEERKKTELSTARTLWGQSFIGTGKIWRPQDGDIIAWASTIYPEECAISIYKDYDRSYITLFRTGICHLYSDALDIKFIRPATNEERQKLFDAMAKAGKRWNAEKKVVEDIPKPHEFKKGEPVLVRDYGGFWVIKAFTKMQDSYCKYMATTDGVDDCGYRECIPYNERTMHLLGTTEDYKEE